MPGVPATPCKKGYKKLKTRLHEEAGEGYGEGDLLRVLSRACKSDYFAGPADRARDIIGPGRVYVYTIPGCKDPYTPPPADNYSGQLDIPRAYKHARTHTSAPIRFPPCSPGVPPIRSLITRRCARSIGNREGNPIARSWNTHDAAAKERSLLVASGAQNFNVEMIKFDR